MWHWEVTLVDARTGEEKKVCGENYSDKQMATDMLIVWLRARLPDLYNGRDLLMIRKAEVVFKTEGSEC